MGALKRKIDTEKKIEKKQPRAVTFSKRRKGLFSKTLELCLLSDAQIAILATPVSANSHNSFYTFGHSSVDSVVAAFLADETPTRDVDDENLGFWWEDESLANSENAEELGDAIVSMKRINQGMEYFDQIFDSEVETQSQAMPMIDYVGEGCSNQGLDFDQIFDSEVHETQSQAAMPMINLDDDEFFSSDFFNDFDIDALYA
ncbi:PREDICTED: agamous-like MADS-box protein AGL97 [Camelina sativa]|uniref:Agamous-like MADS-box protein AGL97 n=1 Tax=Camelina sativa TaxID=90675 RepID=A0ABM0SKU2_CAMSA|nr:PREDICTED: agamous-like MADS-box protein AGL97 [Camelina sativa]XP_010412640.1 PREDICTED: agamous-like MADS-box protein AGL97 [Camelina sativa]